MDFKNDNILSIGIDSNNTFVCSVTEYYTEFYNKTDLELLKKCLDNTLKYYQKNNITDDIIKVINNKNKKEGNQLFNNQFEIKEKKKKKSGVYLISAGKDFLKIGKAECIESRIKALKIGNPYVLNVLYFIEGIGNAESSIHKYFDKLRFEGEWFTYSEDIIESFKIIDSNKEQISKLEGSKDLYYFIYNILKIN